MKKAFNGIIVVEGKTDISTLSPLIDAEFVSTNGSEISDEIINYLKSRANDTRIVILTDPDSPGKRIRDIIEQNIPTVSHCFIEKKYAIKKGKVGVAECDVEHLLNALNNVVSFTNSNKVTISMNDLYALGLVGEKSYNNRQKVSNYYHIGHTNAKTLLKRLNGMGITKEDIEKIL